MSEVEQIENRIKNLSPEELAKLRAWFAEFDAQSWHSQIEADSAAGKLDRFIEESLAEHETGNSRSL